MPDRYANNSLVSGNNISQDNKNVKLSKEELDNSSFSLLTNKKETNLGTYQDGLSKTDKSYKYNKVISYDII